MNEPLRTYWSRIEGERLVIGTTKGNFTAAIADVRLPLQDGAVSPLWPWQHPEVGHQVAFACLFHHMVQLRGHAEAPLLARAWHTDFYRAFLAECVDDNLAIDETRIDLWALQWCLDEAARTRELRRTKVTASFTNN